MGGVIFPPTIAVDTPAFTVERVRQYGTITADMNPIHVDETFAATSRFGRPIVHGLFVVAPIWSAVEREFGAAAMAGAKSDFRFVAPTFVGAMPRYSVMLTGVDAGQARYAVEIADEDGKLAVTGTLTLPA